MLGDRAAEGRTQYSLGCDFEFSGDLHEALRNYETNVELYNDMRALLQSEDVWKITFRNACRHACVQRTDEALCVAEQGRAQALMDLMKMQYNSELPMFGTFQPHMTIADLLSDASTQTVFVALDGNPYPIYDQNLRFSLPFFMT